MMQWCGSLVDEAATQALACRLAEVIQAPLSVYLYGELGSGKTTLVRALLRALHVQGPIKSPTFTLVEPYVLPTGMAYHFDLYRLVSGDELDYLGWRDYFTVDTLCFVEWPEKAQGQLPEPDLAVYLQFAGQGRTCRLVANTSMADTIVNFVQVNWDNEH